MGNNLDEKLKKFVEWVGSVDKETHFYRQDLVQAKLYDVDWVNLRRILTGREAADIYLELEHNSRLILTAGPLECNAFELVSLINGREMVPAGEVFDLGYNVNLRTRAPGFDVTERILTFSERQLPTQSYKDLFSRFLKSRKNIQRARNAGMDRISPYAQGSIKKSS